MTLEDFFTLKEMKDGLTTPTRVEELIGAMREQKDSTTSIVVDATIVANTIASTDNTECLNHFVYLDGLCFLNQWLQEALKYDEDLTAGAGLIKVLLSSLEKLPVDRKKLNASGIFVTVEKLFGHEVGNVKERAQTLFEKWSNEDLDVGGGGDDDDDGCFEIEKIDDNLKPSTDVEEESHNNLQGDIVNDRLKGSTLHQSPKCELNPTPTSQEKLSAEEVSASTTSSSSPKDHMNDDDKCITSTDKNDVCIAAEVNVSDQTASSPAKKPIEMSLTSSNLESKEGNLIESESNGSNLGEQIADGLHDIWINGSPQRNETTENTSEGNEPCSEPALMPCKERDALKCSDPYEKSDSEGDSGDFDALEVARRVAIQVEREVVDYREQSTSSPEVSSRDVVSTASHDIANTKLEAIQNASVSGQDVSDTACSPKTENCKEKQRLESAVHEKKCEFDLNMDVCSEDPDCAFDPLPNNPVNLSAPIPVFASKGELSPGLPVTPLHFEGEQGWRGSAATSAFRPASPRRSVDGVNSNSGSKRKGSFFEIDLNVVDSENEVDVLPTLVKDEVDSSVEVSSGRPERMHLDLNSIGEDEAAPSLYSSLLRCPSPTSSSTTRLPLIRNFDLNDIPYSVFDVAGPRSPNPSNASTAHVIKDMSITGARMAVERTGMRPGYFDTFAHGRPLIPYNHQASPPGYCCIGPVLPFQQAFYGPGNIPHMMDSRSATIGTPLATQPFLMTLASASSSSYGVGPSHSTLDLNSAMMQMENGSRFVPGHGSQQPASGIPLKRKEPDSGWDPYGIGYNQVNSWH